MAIRGKKPRPLRDRFEEKVDRSRGPYECHIWTGSFHRFGYGQLGVGSARDGTETKRHAHRIAYELYVGPIPAGMCVCHKCDNPSCVNYHHLFLGTKAENSRDTVRKGRHPAVTKPESYERRHLAIRGAGNPAAKFSDETITAVRRDLAAHIPQAEIAKRYGLSQPYVCNLNTGRRRPSQNQG